jgi:SNF2 family DNA or RNA helicase
MQNNLKVLFAVVNFVHPGTFGTYHNFDVNFVRPIKAGLQSNARPMELSAGKDASETLYSRLTPVYLRRDKKTYLAESLPKKEDNVLLCSMSKVKPRKRKQKKKFFKLFFNLKLQIDVYGRILQQPDVQLLKLSIETCPDHMVPRRQCCMANRSTEVQSAVLRTLSSLR